MSYPVMTLQEFRDRQDVELFTCRDSCPHFDSLNECCWLSWWHKWYGDQCDYNLVEDSEMNLFRLQSEEEAEG